MWHAWKDLLLLQLFYWYSLLLGCYALSNSPLPSPQCYAVLPWSQLTMDWNVSQNNSLPLKVTSGYKVLSQQVRQAAYLMKGQFDTILWLRSSYCMACLQMLCHDGIETCYKVNSYWNLGKAVVLSEIKIPKNLMQRRNSLSKVSFFLRNDLFSLT